MLTSTNSSLGVPLADEEVPLAAPSQNATTQSISARRTASPSVSPTVGSGILSSLRYYDRLSQSTSSHTRINHVSVFPDGSEDNVTICHLIDLNHHSYENPTTGESFNDPFKLGPQAVTAIALALQHLNTKDGSVIQELSDLQCPNNLKFTAEFFDTAHREIKAVDAVTHVLQRTGHRQPCVFTGSSQSTVTMASAVVTGVHGYPQVSPEAVASQLEDREQFPLFARLSPRSGSEATPLLDLLASEELNTVSHLMVVYTDDLEAVVIVNQLSRVSFVRHPEISIQFVAVPSDAKEFGQTVNDIKKNGGQYIFTSLADGQYEPFMEEAFQQGIAGDGEHVWLTFHNIAQHFHGREFKEDEPFFQAAKGVVRFAGGGAVDSAGRYGAFEEAWKQLGESDEDLEYLKSLLPLFSDDPSILDVMDSSLFQVPLSSLPLVYDTAILVGMAACEAGHTFTGEEHYASILNTSFVGATGPVALDPTTGSLADSSFIGTLQNIRPHRMDNGKYTLVAYTVGTYSNSTWTLEDKIVFNDGTTTPPSGLPNLVVEFNYIGHHLRMGGFALAAVVILASAFVSLWTARGRKSRVIRAAQPIFLLCISGGTALMGASIIPLAIDDEIVSTPSCMAFPWLFALGWCFVFSAIFSKTMRVNKIFRNPRFTRIQVSAVDVMMPMACLLLGAFPLLRSDQAPV